MAINNLAPQLKELADRTQIRTMKKDIRRLKEAGFTKGNAKVNEEIIRPEKIEVETKEQLQPIKQQEAGIRIAEAPIVIEAKPAENKIQNQDAVIPQLDTTVKDTLGTPIPNKIEIKPKEQELQQVKQQAEAPKIIEKKPVVEKIQEQDILTPQSDAQIKNNLKYPTSNKTEVKEKEIDPILRASSIPMENTVNKPDQEEEKRRKFIEDVERWASYSAKNEAQ